MSELKVKQYYALAAAFGYLEARIDIDGGVVARLTYNELAAAFPEAAHLVDQKYLDSEVTIGYVAASLREPCS